MLGWISIIYALLGFFSNTCGTASLFLGDFGLKLAGIDVEGGLEMPAWITVSTVVTGAIGLILAGVLAVGAVGLIRRRAAAVRLLKFWVVATICSVFIHIVLGFLAIDNNVDLQLRIQEASVRMIRERNQEISGQELSRMGMDKSEDEIRSASTRNILIVGGLPMIYPVVIGFLLTNRRRASQVESWNDRVV